MDTLYVVMPAYNEEENIEEVVASWMPVLELADNESKMVIADSGSTDRTHDILCELMKKYKRLEVLSDTGKQHGPKVFALYDYAIKNNADYVFQTDSDGQTNPAEFESFWEKRNVYDAVIGKRLVRGDGKQRAFVEKVVCILLKLYFNVNVPDANAPFRLMKTDLVAKYLYRLAPDFNLPNIMITTYFAYYKENILFDEITFRPRQAGTNSVNIPNIIKIGLNALDDFKKLKKEGNM